MANSMDAVSDRDFAVEFLAAAALCATHLPGWPKSLSFGHRTGSGLSGCRMRFPPARRSCRKSATPTPLNLSAKLGRINGSLITPLTVLKGLPLTYGKVMQEDKEPVFDAAESLQIALAASTGMMRDLAFQLRGQRGGT